MKEVAYARVKTMKRIIIFGKRKFICELKKVAVRGGKKAVEKVFCKEVKKAKQKAH